MSSIYNKNYINVTYNNKKSSYPAKFCKHIFNEYDRKCKIIDLGCGNGDFTEEIRKLNFNVHGIDINPPKGKHYKKVDIQHDKYPYKNNSVDIIFSKSVIEHLRDPEYMVNEVYRLLKPGGVFICMTPSWKHSFKEQFYIDHTHYTPFTRYSLETICKLSGFKPSCKYFYQLPLIWKTPILHILRTILNTLQLPYKPFSKWNWWPSEVNKVIRFSREAMLICKAKK